MMDKVTRQSPQTTTFFKGKESRRPGLMGINESHFMHRVAGSEEMCVCMCVCVWGGGGGRRVTQPYESSETVWTRLNWTLLTFSLSPPTPSLINRVVTVDVVHNSLGSVWKSW